MDILALEMQQQLDPASSSIHFFTACHETPLYSHLHQNVSTWFPDCAPANRERPQGSEAHQLELDPVGFTQRMYAPGTARGLSSWPTFVVSTFSQLDDFFIQQGYTLVSRSLVSYMTGTHVGLILGHDRLSWTL